MASEPRDTQNQAAGPQASNAGTLAGKPGAAGGRGGRP